MLFGLGMQNKKVKELRKNQGLTARELAKMIKVDTVDILKVEELTLKEVPEPLKTKMTPILRGNHLNKIPW
ncbi:MAG: transcriptional regulator [Firmicutes bacterium]|nr:transcriptional regulator [Bacillota bacterium]